MPNERATFTRLGPNLALIRTQRELRLIAQDTHATVLVHLGADRVEDLIAALQASTREDFP